MSQRVVHSRQKAGYVSTVGAAIFLTGAFLLTSGIFTKAHSQGNEKKKGGDIVLLMQANPAFKIPGAKKDTTTMDTVPKIVVPKFYNPWPGVLTDATFVKKSSERQGHMEAWMLMEDTCPPFGWPKNKVALHKEELMPAWEDSKMMLRIAFLRGAPLSKIDLKAYSKEELEQINTEWNAIKNSIKEPREPFYTPPGRGDQH